MHKAFLLTDLEKNLYSLFKFPEQKEYSMLCFALILYLSIECYILKIQYKWAIYNLDLKKVLKPCRKYVNVFKTLQKRRFKNVLMYIK